MAQTISEALQASDITSDEQIYRFVKLPANGIMAAAGVVAEAGNPFTALLVDTDEVTLMLEDEDYHQYQKRLLGHEVSEIRYRLITFTAELEPTLVGFMAHISGALADAGISLMPFAAYTRDHILVAESNFDQAMTILNSLKDQA